MSGGWNERITYLAGSVYVTLTWRCAAQGTKFGWQRSSSRHKNPLVIPMPRRVPSFAAFVFATGLLTAACDSTEPRGPGSIFISSSATQPEPNPQFFQYDIIVDNGSPRTAFIFEPVTLIVNGLAPGAHQVRLGGVPTTCNIGENPRQLTLRG